MLVAVVDCLLTVLLHLALIKFGFTEDDDRGTRCLPKDASKPHFKSPTGLCLSFLSHLVCLKFEISQEYCSDAPVI